MLTSSEKVINWTGQISRVFQVWTGFFCNSIICKKIECTDLQNSIWFVFSDKTDEVKKEEVPDKDEEDPGAPAGEIKKSLDTQCAFVKCLQIYLSHPSSITHVRCNTNGLL